MSPVEDHCRVARGEFGGGPPAAPSNHIADPAMAAIRGPEIETTAETEKTCGGEAPTREIRLGLEWAIIPADET